MSENWRHSEICILINNKSQGNIANRLSYDGFSLQIYHSICCWTEFLKSVNIWQSYRQNGWLCTAFWSFFFVTAVVYRQSWYFLYGWCEHLFVSELSNVYFTRQHFKTVFEWVSLALITCWTRRFFERRYFTTLCSDMFKVVKYLNMTLLQIYYWIYYWV